MKPRVLVAEIFGIQVFCHSSPLETLQSTCYGYQLPSVLANEIKLYEMDVWTEYLRKYTHVLWSVGHVS